MKFSKKLIAGVLMFALIITAFVGCNSKEDTSNKTSENDSAMTGDITVVSREEGSGTRDAFTELLGIVDADENDATTASAEITNSTSVMITSVEGNKYAIGYVSLGSLSDTVKAVKVDGVEATAEKVASGDYAVARPFNLAYDEKKISDLAKDLIDFVMSKEGQDIIEEEGYVRVSEGESYESKKMSGKITISGSTSVAPVMDVLKDAYIELNPDVKIEIQQPGSSAGIESAIKGVADIATSSRDLKDEEVDKLTSVKIATDGIAVIINKENTVEDLASDKIKDIYLGNITTWDEVQ